MKTKNIILIALLAILAVLASCKKDHDIPTGKVFNGGEVLTDSVVDYEKLLVIVLLILYGLKSRHISFALIRFW